MFDQRAIFAKLVQIFNNDGLNEVFAKRYDNPTLCRFYASGYINNLLKHFQQATQHLGKCGDLRLPANGLFIVEQPGGRSISELQQEFKRRE